MIIEDFVSFEIAKLLKEKGFNEPCYGWYDGKGDICAKFLNPEIPLNYPSRESYLCPYYLCPSQSVVMKWLRVTKKIVISICDCSPTKESTTLKDFYWIVRLPDRTVDCTGHYSYEEAVEDAIRYCLTYHV